MRNLVVGAASVDAGAVRYLLALVKFCAVPLSAVDQGMWVSLLRLFHDIAVETHCRSTTDS